MIGFNRNLDTVLAARLAHLQNRDAREAVLDALHENALLFNLDRAPTTALMGMEMLAEQLAEWDSIPDWRACLAAMRDDIVATNSFYRGTFLLFLKEIRAYVDTTELCAELTEIVADWDTLAAQFALAIHDLQQLENAGRQLRRLAFREEHFWGKVLDL